MCRAALLLLVFRCVALLYVRKSGQHPVWIGILRRRCLNNLVAGEARTQASAQHQQLHPTPSSSPK